MPLEPIPCPASVREPVTALQRELIAAAKARSQRFRERHPQVTTAIASDPVAFSGMLAWLTAQYNLHGQRFCEWGSGLGVISALAQLAGFQACGIEQDAAFVLEAQTLCHAFALDARFVTGSFVPADTAESFQVIGTFGATCWTPPSMDEDAYRQLGHGASEMDIIYAYPWPRETGLYEALFELVAKPGAILWLYLEGRDPILWRKTEPPARDDAISETGI